MDEQEEREKREEGPAAERVGGDEVAGDGRSGRPLEAGAVRYRPRGAPRRSARTVHPDAVVSPAFSGEQRLLILDAWQRSKLPATDFAALVGVTATTLYGWRRRFEEEGPAGLVGHKRGARGSQLPEPTRRAILLMKQLHPDWGQDRIHDMLLRSEGLEASAGAVQRALLEEGFEVEEAPTRPHPGLARRFESPEPNRLWQSDLFTFQLKRQVRRVWLVAYLDDHSRYVVGAGLYASSSGKLVREVFEQAIADYGAPEAVLTDNGTQYHTWRGKSAFAKLCQRRGIEQIVASPRHPQTLGKIERFWGTLWRELVEGAIFRDLQEARKRIEHFIAYYNFQRTHRSLGGLVPADRYFNAAPEVRAALEARVAANARELALHGEPRKQVYLTGRVGDAPISLHAEGSRVILTGAGGVREEVDLQAPGRRAPPAPGTSDLDGVLEDLAVLDAMQPEDEDDAPAGGPEKSAGPGSEEPDADEEEAS